MKSDISERHENSLNTLSISGSQRSLPVNRDQETNPNSLEQLLNFIRGMCSCGYMYV